EVGHPINSFYGYQVEGIFQTEQQVAEHATQTGGDIAPGDLMYKDLNGDGVIDGSDRTYLGTHTPKVTYGVNLGLNWKGFNLRVFLQGATGVKGFVQNELLGQVSDGAGKPTSILLDAWTPENHSTTFPRLWDQYTQNDPGTNPSSFWVREASYLRLKNLEVGYTLPQKWTQQLGLSKAKIYYSGQNIFTIRHFYDWVDAVDPAGERGYTYLQVLVKSLGIILTFYLQMQTLMKKPLYICSFLVSTMLGSCKAFVDPEPSDSYGNSTLGTSASDVEAALNSIYNGWSDGMSIIYFDALS